MQDLTVTLVQCELAWERPEDNRRQIGQLIDTITEPTDLIVLPEMFTTGFSMNALANAEEVGGTTEQWMLEQASANNCAVTGSIAVRKGENVYNRMLFASPEGIEFYDKRHLFRMAGEHKRYASGKERVSVSWRDWRINLQVCYDLRFPVFSRNQGDYDLQLFVANWPAKRSYHWRQLLIARAIENQACVVGVNRIGSDANGMDYQGDSLAISANGTILEDLQDRSEVAQVVLSAKELTEYREAFPCHLDADNFALE
ncbi:MAG: omega-amidase [Halioglobus sp.]|jgi:predicted amidohydrolase